MNEKPEFKFVSVSSLIPNPIRDIRQNVLDLIENRIKESGYNHARPLSVIQSDNGYIVADGNHRLEVLKKLNISEVPCIVYQDTSDFYEIAIRSNEDEDTYAPMDIFDWLEVIQSLQSKGKTQEEIGKIIGWSRDKIKNHVIILNRIGTTNLNLAKSYQIGRVPKNGTNVPFLEGWFREIVKLNHENQKRIIEEYIKSNGKLRGVALKKRVNTLLMFEEMVKYLDEHLLDTTIDKSEIINDIYNEVYKTEEQLKKYVNQLNEKSKNLLIHGDCIEEIPKIEDNSISLLITDPPYGINYKSNRRQFENNVTVDILNDETEESAKELFKSMINTVKSKLTEDAHLYVFCSWKNYSIFKEIIEEHYKVKNVLIWDKGNHGAGDLKGNYGERYEMIIFAGNGSRELNGKRNDNILAFSKVPSQSLEHPAQKPVELLKFLIENSTVPGETVIDPFAGVGSVAVACQGRNPYICIEKNERYYKISMRRINNVLQ